MARSANALHLCNAGGSLRGDVPPSEAEDFSNFQTEMVRFGAYFLAQNCCDSFAKLSFNNGDLGLNIH